MNLQTPIKDAGGIYKRYASRLEKLGITKFQDFLYHIPFRYDDFSLISKIGQVQPGEKITIQGTIIEIKNEYTRRSKVLQKAKVSDETGEIDIIWFNQPYIAKTIHQGDKISLSGRIGTFLHKPTMESPEFEVVNAKSSTVHTGRLVPIYPETQGVSSKWIRRQVYKLLDEVIEEMDEFFPEELLNEHTFLTIDNALKRIHFPTSHEDAQKARMRLAFEELFLLQLSVLKRKQEWNKNVIRNTFQISKCQNQLDKFIKTLPFELTNAQKRAISDILKDLSEEQPMNRLLQGDVGSGKTVVAAITMYLAHLNGFQSVLMAPTEMLAQQHYATISNLLLPFGVKVDLATGSKKSSMYHVSSSKYKKEEKIHNTKYIIQNTDILIGTHAVLNIGYKNLGLVVIDEQHRFGVEQRAKIREKGKNPHLLSMTATPIPRTVALTLYGDLDLSYLDELPKGRKKIKTWLVPKVKRENAYKWIDEQIKTTNSQAFIICPFIEESESLQTVKAAKKEYEHLKNKVFKNLRVGLLHGKMKSKEKDEVLKNFRQKKIDILVATPVVEVGIDIPNATIILIEAAERFGLAGLHQLRGRVGRGEKQSYCLLFTESAGEQTNKRLKVMETNHIGAQLAEIDLELRGPGEIYGTLQHGTRELKIASFSNVPLIEKARREAEKYFPKLSEYPLLKEKIKSISIEHVTPD